MRTSRLTIAALALALPLSLSACGSSDGVPTCGQPSFHSIRSISRIRRLLTSSSCRWRGWFTSIAW